MTIFYLDELDLAAAASLALMTNEPIVPFDLRIKPDAVLTDITLVAHTDDEVRTIGNKTPSQLVADFAQLIPTENRKDLKHLYLISCEAGRNKEGQMPLAQQIAMEMQKIGFSNLLVHAVTPPKGIVIVGMRVSVSTREDISSNQVPGHVNAYFYQDQYSEKYDSKLSALQERIDYLLIKKKSEVLTTSEIIEKTQKRKEEIALLSARANDQQYQRVDILFADYKTELQQDYYTFTASGVKSVINIEVILAIKALQKKRELITNNDELNYKAKTKQLIYIDQHLLKLRANPNANVDEVIHLLKGQLNKEGQWETRSAWEMRHSFYYQTIIAPISAYLKSVVNARKPLSALAPTPTRDLSSRDEEPTPPRSSLLSQQALNVDLLTTHQEVINQRDELDKNPLTLRVTQEPLIQQLSEYKEDREKEWTFHFNFLGIMSMIYYLQDQLSGTDHFNCKKREVKVAAAEKLSQIIQGAAAMRLTKSEIKALQDGRLGKIIAAHGGLDALLPSYTADNYELSHC